MLVLSRRVNEAIMVGDNVQVVVVEIRADRIRLGITAPAAMPVHRSEVAAALAPSRPPTIERIVDIYFETDG